VSERFTVYSALSARAIVRLSWIFQICTWRCSLRICSLSYRSNFCGLCSPGGQLDKRAVLLSVVGQTAANNLVLPLMATGKVRVLGTTVDAIDTAEDRFRFSKLCDILGIDRPKWRAFRTHSLRSC
jgi:hypothetical protein